MERPAITRRTDGAHGRRVIPPPEHAAVTTANRRESLLAALDRPGTFRVNQGDADAAFARAAREEDFIGTTYRAMGVARLKAGLDADGWPIALDVRTSMQEGGFGPDASFNAISRYHVPNYRYSFHTTKFHVPVGTRRGVGQAAHEFYRESFIDELAHAAGRDPYRYRRELLARTNLPYKDDMIKALDMAAEMSGWGAPLRVHALRIASRATIILAGVHE